MDSTLCYLTCCKERKYNAWAWGQRKRSRSIGSRGKGVVQCISLRHGTARYEELQSKSTLLSILHIVFGCVSSNHLLVEVNGMYLVRAIAKVIVVIRLVGDLCSRASITA